MQTANELAVYAKGLQHVRTHAGHDVHAGYDVRRIRDFHAEP